MSMTFSTDDRPSLPGAVVSADDGGLVFPRGTSLNVPKARVPGLRRGAASHELSSGREIPSPKVEEVRSVNRPADAQLVARCREAISWVTTIPVDTLRVSVTDGWLTLEGQVPASWHAEALVDALRHLNGIQGITNRLRTDTYPAS